MEAKVTEEGLIIENLTKMAVKYQDNNDLFTQLNAKFSAFSTAFEKYDLTMNTIEESIVDRQITDFVYLYREWNNKTGYMVNPASLAYIVTKKGCNNYLENIYKIGFKHATDWNMNLYLQSKNIFYGSKYVLCTGNNNFVSEDFQSYSQDRKKVSGH